MIRNVKEREGVSGVGDDGGGGTDLVDFTSEFASCLSVSPRTIRLGVFCAQALAADANS